MSPNMSNSGYKHKVLAKVTSVFTSVFEHLLTLRALLWLCHMLSAAAYHSQCALFSCSKSISVFIYAFQCFFVVNHSCFKSFITGHLLESKTIRSLVECWQAAMTPTQVCAPPGFEISRMRATLWNKLNS